MVRAYARFGIILEMAIAVLAGFGLLYITEKSSPLRKRFAVGALFLLVAFEFFNWPPDHVLDLSQPPPVYRWLKEQPTGTVVAEYPLETNSPNPLYMFYQTVHEKPLINCAIPGTRAHRIAQVIADLSNPDTPHILKWLGAECVIVHTQEFEDSGLVKRLEELQAVRQSPDLKLYRKIDGDEIYRITCGTLDPNID